MLQSPGRVAHLDWVEAGEGFRHYKVRHACSGEKRALNERSCGHVLVKERHVIADPWTHSEVRQVCKVGSQNRDASNDGCLSSWRLCADKRISVARLRPWKLFYVLIGDGWQPR